MLSTVESPVQLDKLLGSHELVFVDFWAEWCAPCKQFAKIYESVAAEYPDAVFAKVNIEQVPDLAEMFQIRSIPHLMILKQGIAVYSEAGSMPESTFRELVTQALSVDVSDIRAKLDEENGQQ